MDLMRRHLRFVILAAWLAVVAQAAVSIEAAWHHHDHAAGERGDNGCAVCAAVATVGRLTDPPAQVCSPLFLHFVRDRDEQRSAFLHGLPGLASTGPPASAAF